MASIIASLVLAFWVFYKKMLAFYPGLYVGLSDSLSGIYNIEGLWSNINYGEPRIQNTWLIIVSKFYFILNNLGVSSHLITSIIIFLSLLLSFVYIRKLLNIFYENKGSDFFIFFIALGFSFSTFSLTFFEDNTFFIIIYWLLPFKLWCIKNMKTSPKYKLYNFLVLFLAASMNLPFAFFIEGLSIFFMYLLGVCRKVDGISFKKYINYIGLSFLTIFISLSPAILHTFLSSGYSSYVLASETFYKSNTSALSFFRGITDWGFFDGYAGFLYRDYSLFFKTWFGSLTFLIFSAPLIILNKNKQKLNIIIIACIFLVMSLILSNKYLLSEIIAYPFEKLPMYEIFRNGSKFFFVINGLFLIMFIFNKNIKLASAAYFLSALPIIFLFVTGDILTHKTTNQTMAEDYSKIYSYFKKEDNVLLLPKQYTPVYADNKNGIQLVMGYSRPEFFTRSNIIVARCAGCYNPVLEKNVKIMTDIGDPSWATKIKEFGVTHILYDSNVAFNYYRDLASLEEIKEKLLASSIIFEEEKINSLTIIKLVSIENKNIIACDPGWFEIKNFSLKSKCQNERITFDKNEKHFYLPNLFAYTQILALILIISFYFYKLKYKKS